MIEIQNVNFRYSGGRDGSGLHNITLTVPDGGVLLVCGGSGCGKSTLTRLVNGLIPHFYDGELSGKVIVNGLDIAEAPLYDTAKLVGSVFQNPRSQFFNVDTTSELAFSCENMGMPENEVCSRMELTVDELRLRPLLDRSIFELSGGEKQRIACGSVSTLSPEVVVLNEPTYRLFRPDLENPTRDDYDVAALTLNKMPTTGLDPVDISNAILYLVADSGRFVTGTTHVVDAGGQL